MADARHFKPAYCDYSERVLHMREIKSKINRHVKTAYTTGGSRMNRAIVTVLGRDRVGIIASVSSG
jgi:hypothetical protein